MVAQAVRGSVRRAVTEGVAAAQKGSDAAQSAERNAEAEVPRDIAEAVAMRSVRSRGVKGAPLLALVVEEKATGHLRDGSADGLYRQLAQPGHQAHVARRRVGSGVMEPAGRTASSARAAWTSSARPGDRAAMALFDQSKSD